MENNLEDSIEDAKISKIIEAIERIKAKDDPKSSFNTIVTWLCSGGLVIIITGALWLFSLGSNFERIRADIDRSLQETKLEIRLLKQQIDSNTNLISENKSSINRDILKRLNQLSSDVAVIKSELQKNK